MERDWCGIAVLPIITEIDDDGCVLRSLAPGKSG